MHCDRMISKWGFAHFIRSIVHWLKYFRRSSSLRHLILKKHSLRCCIYVFHLIIRHLTEIYIIYMNMNMEPKAKFTEHIIKLFLTNIYVAMKNYCGNISNFLIIDVLMILI